MAEGARIAPAGAATTSGRMLKGAAVYTRDGEMGHLRRQSKHLLLRYRPPQLSRSRGWQLQETKHVGADAEETGIWTRGGE
jgi:hypothetical protein